MTCPHCLGIEKEFNADVARRELRDYRQRGPGKATRLLITELTRRGLRGSTLLDIGGGVGGGGRDKGDRRGCLERLPGGRQ